MYALFLVFLVGGLVATALLATLGGLAGHLHAGPAHAHPLSGSHVPAYLPGGEQVHSLAHHGAAHATQAQLSAHGMAAPGHTSDTGHAGAVAAHEPAWAAVALGWALSWLSPLTLAGAALGFGGVGLIVWSFATALALPLAIVGAIAGAVAVRILITAFVRAETPALQARADGALGLINAPIRADCAGEVVYTLEGLTRSAPARTLDGTPLPRGARVVIVRRERGMAWVEALNPLDPFPDGVPSPGPPIDRAGTGAAATHGNDATGAIGTTEGTA